MRYGLVGFVLIAALVAGCSSQAPQAGARGDEVAAAAETPADALRAIIALYQARDFDRLVRTRYAEIGKAENDQQVQALIDRFTSRYADDSMLERAVAAYRAALAVEPEISDDGAVATFNLERGFIRLSKMADGRWGFHL